MSSTSSSLLRQVQARDPDAWRRLADLYGPLVYFWCRRYGLVREDAADVMQETFAAVAGSIHSFQNQTGSGGFRGWLWTITRNKIRDWYRQNEHRVVAAGGSGTNARLAEIPESLQDESSEALERSQTHALLHRGLEQVRGEFEDRTWQAFWRVTVEGHSTAEVAADLAITANAVRQAKSRVLRRLREVLGDVLD